MRGVLDCMVTSHVSVISYPFQSLVQSLATIVQCVAEWHATVGVRLQGEERKVGLLTVIHPWCLCS